MKVIDNIEIDTDFYLRDIENFLRNNIAFILKDKYGENWEDKLGVSDNRIKIWKQRKKEEKTRLNGKELESRLLYYSDFYDLREIMDKNWDIFINIFKNKRELEYQLEVLESIWLHS